MKYQLLEARVRAAVHEALGAEMDDIEHVEVVINLRMKPGIDKIKIRVLPERDAQPPT